MNPHLDPIDHLDFTPAEDVVRGWQSVVQTVRYPCSEEWVREEMTSCGEEDGQ